MMRHVPLDESSVANAVVRALEHVAERVSRALGRDAARAVEGLYRDAGTRTRQVIQRITRADDESTHKILSVTEQLRQSSSTRTTTRGVQGPSRATSYEAPQRRFRDLLEAGSSTRDAKAGAGENLFSRSSARTNMDMLTNGGGLERTPEMVISYAARSGVDLSGVDIHIVHDVNEARYLDFQGACACTPPELEGNQIRFGPASFADEDTLVATIAHEKTHVDQLRSNVELSTASIRSLEDEAYASEGPALARFHGDAR